MSGYRLDTNVTSEIKRDVPSPSVLASLSDEDDHWQLTIMIHELDHGLQLPPMGHRRI